MRRFGCLGFEFEGVVFLPKSSSLPGFSPVSNLDDPFFLALSFHAVAVWQVTVVRNLLLFSVFFCSCTGRWLFCSSSASFSLSSSAFVNINQGLDRKDLAADVGVFMAMANLASIILLCMLFSFLMLFICLPPVSCLQSSPPTRWPSCPLFPMSFP